MSALQQPVLTGEIVVPGTVVIPADVDALGAQLEGLARLAVASEWARAAIVAAYVEPQNGKGHRLNDSSVISCEDFAALGYAGLKSHMTVRAYARAWLDRYPRPERGAIADLPAEPFPGGNTRHTPDGDNEWYTPSWLFEQLSVTFDMDVCAPVDPSLRNCPAHRYLTQNDDGLTTPWQGVVWCNPPYGSGTAPWIERWASHDEALLLTHYSVRAATMPRIWHAADAIVMFSKMAFDRPREGMETEPFWGIQLAGRGHVADSLERVSHKYAGPMWKPVAA